MTLREAITKRVERVRDKTWNDQAYIKLSYSDGYLHPVIFLVDPPGQEAFGIKTGSQELTIFDLNPIMDTEVEEFVGTPSLGF